MAFELHSSYACRVILNVQWLGLSVNIHNLQVLHMPRLLCSLVGCTALLATASNARQWPGKS